MTKYAIYTKWYWSNGIASAEEMQNRMKENLVGKTEAEDIIFWKGMNIIINQLSFSPQKM